MMNFQNIQMVSFVAETRTGLTVYAIRKGWIFYKYLDLGWDNMWWKSVEPFFVRDCTSENYDKVKVIFRNLRSSRDQRRASKQTVIKNP